jgi:predicted DNA-binding transcriptional regulator AlpA
MKRPGHSEDGEEQSVMRRRITKPDTAAGTVLKPIVPETAAAAEAPRLIRLRELQRMIPLSRTSIWRRVAAAGTFPKPLRLSEARNLFWRLDEVIAYIREQTRKRDEA